MAKIEPLKKDIRELPEYNQRQDLAELRKVVTRGMGEKKVNAAFRAERTGKVSAKQRAILYACGIEDTADEYRPRKTSR